MPHHRKRNAERARLEKQRTREQDWRLWGPYLAERAWGTVREDYSADGTAWEHFPHDQAPARAYRWNEDGLGGICDEQQRVCFALALWNGKDPILKERAFGLTGNQGNRAEDVKEYYFYLDATPSHSYLRYLYKYPQARFPYEDLVEENARRTRHDAPYNLLDTGALADDRAWDVEVRYAKASPDEIHVRVIAENCGPEEAELHLLPTLWYRNTWSWGDMVARPRLKDGPEAEGAAWSVEVPHMTLGGYFLYGRERAELLYTENESNHQRLWGTPNAGPYTKDAFHRCVVEGDASAVNPERVGTKVAAWSKRSAQPGERIVLDMVLSREALETPFASTDECFARREQEADEFYRDLLPEASEQDHRILRQALAGTIWTKQFFHFDVERWRDGDVVPPPPERRGPDARNAQWRHLEARDVISMPDAWEYPWFAAWDLAYHCVALSLVDVDFAKDQVELLLSDRYLHPHGQIPAYEWAFSDVNPPVHAMGALKVFRAERVQRGEGDFGYLQRVFHKLLLNYAWWINRKDSDGHNLFEGGFLGLDNISAFDRSHIHLPEGWLFKQADATGWMAMFSLNLTVMALELATKYPDYEDIAIQSYHQFLSIADAISGDDDGGMTLWDEESEFYMDLLVRWEGGKAVEKRYIRAFSWVGLIPLFAAEVVDERLLKNAPRFRRLLQSSKGGLFRGHHICACPDWENERGEHLLALVDHTRLPAILRRLLDETQFLSRYGVRGLSKIHTANSVVGWMPGEAAPATVTYNPGESNTPLFGGNSNWRGPVWMPTNYSLIQALEKFHRFLGPNFRVEVPCAGNKALNLREIATLISERLVDLYRRDDEGHVPALRRDSPFQDNPRWRDLMLFYEYFHAETGQGLGAAHQTGWTALLANLVMRRYQRDVKPWSGLDRGEKPSWIEEIA
jgi:hypothetical protein